MTGKKDSDGRVAASAQSRRPMRYHPARKPKLLSAALAAPPPVPEPSQPHSETVRTEPFPGEIQPEEIGLRVLAALESIPSLEPDYCDDLTAEASVTIVERADACEPEPSRFSQQAEDHGSLRARLHDMGEAPEIVPDEYAAYQGPIEEATVEIVERPPEGQNAASSPELWDLPVRRRFLKALANGGSEAS